jgi:serine/threonine-protein kinase
VAALAALLLLAQPGFAQSTAAQKATAEAFFDDGLRAMKSGNFNEACTKLEASQRLEPAVGTLLYLGECYEKRGRTASAWVTFREAEALARANGQAPRAEMARAHADKLQAGLSRVTVDISSEARALPGLQVRCGSVPIDPALPGVAVPVDPGELVVEASAPGYATFSRSLTVPAGGRLTVSVPPLVRQAAPDSPATSASAPPAPSAPSAATPHKGSAGTPTAGMSPDAEPGASHARSLVWPLTLGAVGVVGLGVGSLFGANAVSNASDANELCPDGRCSEERGETLMDRARTQARISNVAFALGAAGVAAGVIVYVLDTPKNSQTKLGVSPWLGYGQAGVAVRGRL